MFEYILVEISHIYQIVVDILRNFSKLHLMRSCGVMAVATGVEGKILKILRHAPLEASQSFGCGTLVPQPATDDVHYLLGRGVRMFFMRPAAMKAPACKPAQNNCIVPGLLSNMKGGWGTTPAVLSGANRGRRRALKLSRCPVSGSPNWLAVIHTAGLIASDLGYVFVCVSQLGCRELCFCVCPVIENLSSTALNRWLIWPCWHNPFVSPTVSKKNFHQAAFHT